MSQLSSMTHKNKRQHTFYRNSMDNSLLMYLYQQENIDEIANFTYYYPEFNLATVLEKINMRQPDLTNKL